MSVCRLVAGLVGLVLAAVVVTVVVAVGSEVRAELAPAVAKDESSVAGAPSKRFIARNLRLGEKPGLKIQGLYQFTFSAN